MEKVENLLKRTISEIIMYDLNDADLNFRLVSVSDITVSKDLSSAKVYISLLDEEKKQDILKALNKAAHFIRKQLFQKVQMRAVPKLKFHLDNTIVHGQQLSQFIDKANQSDE